MSYRSVTHVSIRVPRLREAETYYRKLFGLEVAFREAESPDGWRTLPEGAGWDEAEGAGVSLLMSLLWRDGFRLALELEPAVERTGILDHVGLLVDPQDLEVLRDQAVEVGVEIPLQRETLLILDDRYGVRWEVTTIIHEDPHSESSGATRGSWIDLAT